MLNYRIESSGLVERAGLDRGKRAGSTSGQINSQGLKVNEDEDSGFIERFHSRGHCWNQNSAYIRKKFNSHGIGWKTNKVATTSFENALYHPLEMVFDPR